MVVTESWPPNVERAPALHSPGGVEVVQSLHNGSIPLPDRSFELVTIALCEVP